MSVAVQATTAAATPPMVAACACWQADVAKPRPATTTSVAPVVDRGPRGDTSADRSRDLRVTAMAAVAAPWPATTTLRACVPEGMAGLRLQVSCVGEALATGQV